MNSPEIKTEIVRISLTPAHVRKRSLPLQQADRTGWGLQRTGLRSQETPRSAEENLCAESIVHSEKNFKKMGFFYDVFARKWVHLGSFCKEMGTFMKF